MADQEEWARAYIAQKYGRPMRTTTCDADAHAPLDGYTDEQWEWHLGALEAGRCPCCGGRLERHADERHPAEDDYDWAGCRPCCWDYQLRKLDPDERITPDEDAIITTGWPQPV